MRYSLHNYEGHRIGEAETAQAIAEKAKPGQWSYDTQTRNSVVYDRCNVINAIVGTPYTYRFEAMEHAKRIAIETLNTNGIEKMNNANKMAKAILSYICDKEYSSVGYQEAKEALKILRDSMGKDDFTFEFDGAEFRIIAESVIWDIYVEEIRTIVTDCYDLKLHKIPDFIAIEIDWEQTAKNAYVDGYGHTFAGYDGEEKNIQTGEYDYWIFRTD